MRHSRATLACKTRFKIARVSQICNPVSLYTQTHKVVISNRIYCLRDKCSAASLCPRCSTDLWVWTLAPIRLKVSNRACRSSKSATNSSSNKYLNRSHISSNSASLRPVRPCNSHNNMGKSSKTIAPDRHSKSRHSQTTPSCHSSSNRTPTLRISRIWCTWRLKTASRAPSSNSNVSFLPF